MEALSFILYVVTLIILQPAPALDEVFNQIAQNIFQARSIPFSGKYRYRRKVPVSCSHVAVTFRSYILFKFCFVSLGRDLLAKLFCELFFILFENVFVDATENIA